MTAPPPTPKRPLNAPARLAITARRTSLDDMAGILGRVPAPTADTVTETLRPLTDAPGSAGIFLDVDGTLAPIVERAEQAHVPEKTSRMLGTLARRYRMVACVSGRAAAEARRLVGGGGIVYAGSHGAELLEPGAARPVILPAFETWTDRVQDFARGADTRELRGLRVRIEGKGPLVACHPPGSPDEDSARTLLEGIAAEAESAGLIVHWGRKVLEIRPPVAVDKGQAVRELMRRSPGHPAVVAG